MNFDDETANFQEYQDLLGVFDLISDHTHTHWPYMQKCISPELVIQATQHSQANFQAPRSPNPNVPLPEPKPYNFCGISNFHSRECSGVTGMVFRTLYDGVDLSRYPYQETKGNRLLFVGRMEPFKGATIAIWVAKTCRMPLDLIGKDSDTNQQYVAQVKREVADAQKQNFDIQYHGEVDHETKLKYMQNAFAVLFPAAWAEPFGLVPIEAASCGTPTIATTAGALPEIIKHGTTGFLANSIEELAEFTLRAGQINPVDCRNWVEQRFSSKIMAENYERLWREILDGKGW